MGLAIVKKLISMQGGDLKAYGKEQEGAVFEMILPVHQPGLTELSAVAKEDTTNQ